MVMVERTFAYLILGGMLTAGCANGTADGGGAASTDTGGVVGNAGASGASALGGDGSGDGGTDGGGQAGFGGSAAGSPAGRAGTGGTAGEDPGSRKRMFVTTGAATGNLYRNPGGLEAGDYQCNLSAGALGGVWRAWLSSVTVNALDRIDDVGPWYLVDRTSLVFDNKEQLAAGPLVPIDMGESGERLAGKPVWTGTAPAGTSAADTCSNWTSDRPTVAGQAGRSDMTGPGWTSATVETCGLYAALYCVEQ